MVISAPNPHHAGDASMSIFAPHEEVVARDTMPP